MGRIEEQAALVAAVMEAAGVDELFVSHEVLSGLTPVTITWFDDHMRDGVLFRIIRPREFVDGEVIEKRKEVEP